MKPVTLIKRGIRGEETWRYPGTVLGEEGAAVVVEALFNREDRVFMDVLLKRGDRFVETFYTDRWYNLMEIHDREDDRVKGWYCNIAKPACWEAEDQLSYVDLALDLWVAADGRLTVLDEDEFAALDLDEETKTQARAALEEVIGLFKAQ